MKADDILIDWLQGGRFHVCDPLWRVANSLTDDGVL